MTKQKFKIGFTLLLLAFVTMLLVLTWNLGRIAALVPTWVGMFTLGLLLLQLFWDLRPKPPVKNRETNRGQFSVYAAIKAIARTGTTAPARETSPDIPRKLRMLMWFLLMVVSIYLLGLLVAVPLYAFLYWRWHAKEGWLSSLTMAGALLGVIYGLFVLMLEKPLYKGHLTVWLGF